jgi:uncharacterized protein YceK
MRPLLLSLLATLLLCGCGGAAKMTREASYAAVCAAYPGAKVYAAMDHKWRFIVLDGERVYYIYCGSYHHDGPTSIELYVPLAATQPDKR